MPRVRRQVILEDPARPVTPDMIDTKLSMYQLQVTSLFLINLSMYFIYTI